MIDYLMGSGTNPLIHSLFHSLSLPLVETLIKSLNKIHKSYSSFLDYVNQLLKADEILINQLIFKNLDFKKINNSKNRYLLYFFIKI